MSSTAIRKFAVVTGGSSGIGFELAQQFAAHQFDVMIAADQGLDGATQKLNSSDEVGEITSIKADLSTHEGVVLLYDAILHTACSV